MKVVILHDYLTQPGGAERVVATMLERWPDAELRTLVHDADGTFPEFNDHAPVTSPLQRVAGRASHRALLPVLPLATRSLAVGPGEADVVISSSSGWAHGIPVAPGIPHVCYCHNPARWLYDAERYIGNPLLRTLLRPLLALLRRWDQAAARRPDPLPREQRERARPDRARLRPPGRRAPAADQHRPALAQPAAARTGTCSC